MRLRVARSLVFLQAAILVIAAVFVVVVSTLLGTGNSIPFAGAALTGRAAIGLGVGYAALGMLCLWIGMALGRSASWSRGAAIGVEVVLAALFIVRGEVSATTAVSLVLCAVVVGLILASRAPA